MTVQNPCGPLVQKFATPFASSGGNWNAPGWKHTPRSHCPPCHSTFNDPATLNRSAASRRHLKILGICWRSDSPSAIHARVHCCLLVVQLVFVYFSCTSPSGSPAGGFCTLLGFTRLQPEKLQQSEELPPHGFWPVISQIVNTSAGTAVVNSCIYVFGDSEISLVLNPISFLDTRKPLLLAFFQVELGDKSEEMRKPFIICSVVTFRHWLKMMLVFLMQLN